MTITTCAGCGARLMPATIKAGHDRCFLCQTDEQRDAAVEAVKATRPAPRKTVRARVTWPSRGIGLARCTCYREDNRCWRHDR